MARTTKLILTYVELQTVSTVELSPEGLVTCRLRGAPRAETTQRILQQCQNYIEILQMRNKPAGILLTVAQAGRSFYKLPQVIRQVMDSDVSALAVVVDGAALRWWLYGTTYFKRKRILYTSSEPAALLWLTTKMKQKNSPKQTQSGSAALIVLVVAVVALVGLIGWQVVRHHHASQAATAQTKQSATSSSGGGTSPANSDLNQDLQGINSAMNQENSDSTAANNGLNDSRNQVSVPTN